mmetsp:Transcript_8686/g.16109  ORF Transcript_8686/g.16109 Transcript_8686/m.16109 type:complete len:189 (+) Transcript_8686:1782-2348(+)
MIRRILVLASTKAKDGARGRRHGDEMSSVKDFAKPASNVVEGFADLFKEDKRQSLRMHERFDWKVWNFFLALLPAVALYTTMTYARKDMDRLIEEDKSFMSTRRSKRPEYTGEKERDKQIMEKFEAVDSKMRELSEKLHESKELNRRLQDRVTELQEAQVEKKQGKMKLGLLWSSWLKRKDDGTGTKS